MRLVFRSCALVASFLLALGFGAQAQEPIKIGVLLPFTGPLAKNGIENWEACRSRAI
ncbi:MAG: hypothetical protein WDN50_00490 [Bradyrhizobium sp.]